MEARRTFGEARSYKQLWIILAALLAAAMLSVGAAFVTSGAASNSHSAAPVKTYPAPGTVLNQDKDRGSQPSVYPSPKVHQTVF